jgi:hypothetical protein
MENELEADLQLAQLFEENRIRKAGARKVRRGANMGGFKNFILRGNVVDMQSASWSALLSAP